MTRRFITWNVGHQTRKKALPEAAAVALLSLEPDVIVLTEFVSEGDHKAFLTCLKAAGFTYKCSDPVAGQNQVLIASRLPMRKGHLECTLDFSDATKPNWLHVCLDNGVHVIGLRRPMFVRVPNATERYWEWVCQETAPLRETGAVLLGDFNARPSSRPMRRLEAAGWQVISPAKGNSYFGRNGARAALDHAVVSPNVALGSEKPRYVASANGFAFAGGAQAYSDHAVFTCALRIGALPQSAGSPRLAD